MTASSEDIEDLYWHARQLDPDAREDYLKQLQSDAPQRVDDVRRLLDQEPAAERMFGGLSLHKQPAARLDSAAAGDRPTNGDAIGREAAGPQLQSGETIGPYKLLEPIGEGGMGVVYLAQQSKPVRRKVALKIIKPGMDSRQVVARFEAERQALAMMEHANIAKVLDAGTTEAGLPYFVMELVRGIPMTQYCDRAKMSTKQRLELFCDACIAIQHAHNKGVIHRDIKPSNVLVTEHDGTPIVKVIDFGVAKALTDNLTDKTLFTGMFQMIGTPLYMSPEQASLSNLDVDVRSDVYSLGVMLYELVSGTLPIDRETAKSLSLEQLRQRICDTEPPRPSKRLSTLKDERETIAEHRGLDVKHFHRLVSNEIDWIAMKAIEKDRKRRYRSARELGEDVQRYLDSEAVEACPPSIRYRATKYASRNCVALITLSAIGASLLIATGVSLHFAYKANEALILAEAESKKVLEAKETADKNFKSALEAVDSLLGHASSEELAALPQAQPVRRKILEDALAFYDDFQLSAGDSVDLRLNAAETWRSLAVLSDALNDRAKALEAMRNQIRLTKDLVDEHPSYWRVAYAYIEAEIHLGQYNKYRTMDFEASRQCLDRAGQHLKKSRQHFGSHLDDYRKIKIKYLLLMSGLAFKTNDHSSSAKYAEEAYEEFKRMDKVDPILQWRIPLRLAEALEERDPERAIEFYQQALEHSRQRARDCDSPQEKLHVFWIMNTMLRPLSKTDLESALTLFGTYLKSGIERVIDFPSLSRAFIAFGHIHGNATRFADENSSNQDLLRRFWEVVSAAFEDTEMKYAEISILHARLASLLGEEDESKRSLRRSFELPTASGGSLNADSAYFRGEFFLEAKDYEKALADFELAFKEGRPGSQYKRRALAHFHLGHFDEALEDLRTAFRLTPDDWSIVWWIQEEELQKCQDDAFRHGLIQLANEGVEANPGDSEWKIRRGYVLHGCDRYEEALPDLSIAIDQNPKGFYTWWRRLEAYLHLERWETQFLILRWPSNCEITTSRFTTGTVLPMRKSRKQPATIQRAKECWHHPLPI